MNAHMTMTLAKSAKASGGRTLIELSPKCLQVVRYTGIKPHSIQKIGFTRQGIWNGGQPGMRTVHRKTPSLTLAFVIGIIGSRAIGPSLLPSRCAPRRKVR